MSDTSDISAEDMADLEQRAKVSGRTIEQLIAVFRRSTSLGVASIGEDVIGDNEAIAGGYTPLTKVPLPDSIRDVDYPDDEDISGEPPVVAGRT